MDTPNNAPDTGQDISREHPQDVQGDGQDTTEAWLPLREAAPLMGLSIEAARKRAQRSTIRARKADEGWLVAWPAEMNTPPDSGRDAPHVVLDNNSNAGQDVHQDTGRTSTGRVQDDNIEAPQPFQALIDAQRSEIAFLRGELETRSEEIRRRDHILAGLLQELSTIKALAPGEVIDAEEPTAKSPESGYTPVDAQEGPGRTQPSHMTNETLRGAFVEPVPSQVTLATAWRRWLRRVMGHEG